MTYGGTIILNDPQCSRCGEEEVYHPCPECEATGYVGPDYRPCELCSSAGGWFYCPECEGENEYDFEDAL